jgi:RNA polymerase sigma factor (sigma-70 family)
MTRESGVGDVLHPNEAALRQLYKVEFPRTEAWTELWQWYEPRVFRPMIGRSFQGMDRSESEVVLQETAMKLHEEKTRQGYDAARLWVSWAATILMHEIIDRKRRMATIKKHLSNNLGGEALKDFPSGEKPPDEIMAHKELTGAVAHCLARGAGLSAEERDILLQHIVLGRTQTEIAAEMGVVPSTIHTKVKKALAKLRLCIEKSGFRGLVQ